jgi:hypothetical protein
MARLILKIVLWTVGILLGLLLLVWILIQIPAVQNALVDKLTQSLSRTLQTKVSIDRVNIRLIKTLVLDGIYIESRNNDTLLYARHLGVDIGLFDLFDNRIHVNDITLEGAKIQLFRAEIDSVFNYQFLLDAFNKKPDTTAAETVWTFNIDDVIIKDTYFRMRDESARSDIELNLQDFALNVGDLDMENQVIDINTIRLKDSRVAYTILESSAPKQTKKEPIDTSIIDTSLIEDNGVITFPSVGWTLTINRLQLANNAIFYNDENAQPVVNAVDFSHLGLNDLNIDIKNVAWRDSLIQADIDNISFKENSGFTLNQLAAELEMNNRQIALQNFVFATPQSNIRAATTLRYNTFADFVNDLNNSQLELTVNDSRLAFDDLEYFAPAISEIKQLNTDLNKAIRFSARAQGTLTNLSNFVANLSVEDGVQLRAEGSASNLTDPKRLSYNVNIQELSTSYDNLKRLTRGVAIPAGLDKFGLVRFSGQFQGDLNAVNGRNIILQTDAYTGFQGDLRASGLTNPDQLKYTLNIRELRTQAKDLNGFIAGGLPIQVQNLGRIRYVGSLAGTTTKFNLDGNLNTDAGSAKTDIYIAFNKKYTNATYDAKVNLNRFKLGRVLADTSMGNVSLALTANGSGLSLEQINTKLNGVISAFDFRGYTYRNFRVDGALVKKQFTGKAGIQDPNITFSFDGSVNMNDSFPKLNFVANIDTVNLNRLNLYPTPLSMSAAITANFTGINLDDLDGAARIADLNISSDTAAYHTDSIVLRASEPDTTGKLLTLQSDFINAQISGNYKLADLPKLVQNFVNDYFPIDQLMSPVDQPARLTVTPERVIPDQDFEAVVELHNPVPLLRMFVAGMERLDTAWLTLRLDTKGRDLEIQSGIPQLVFQGNAFNNIRLQAEGTPEELITTLTLQDVAYGANRLSLAEVNVALGDDSLVLRINAEEGSSDTTRTKLALGGNVSRLDENYRVVFEPRLVLNGENWNIPRNNEILYRPNFLDVNNFALEKDGQAIRITTSDSPADADLAPIEVEFANFQIQEIFKLLNQTEDIYSGEINGLVTLRDYGRNLNYLVDLDIVNIALNDQPVGNLRVQAQPAGQQSIQINVDLDGEQSKANIAGTYALNTQRFDIQADLRSLEMRLLDPFAKAFIEDSRGTFSGNFTIRGTASDPNLNGTLNFNDISTLIKLNGVRYTVDEETINLSNESIDFGTFRLVDGSNNAATLSGNVDIRNFNNIGLNLNFDTDRFQLLNTQSQGDALYYGKLFVAADVRIRGTSAAPRVQVNAATLDSSQLFVQPLSAQEAIAGQEDYIIFANPTTFTPADTAKGAYQVNRSSMDLALNLNITERTELQVIIDPATGDKLVCRGNADLNVDMSPNTDLKITGAYEIASGSYSLNYQGVLKREFRLRPGSRLTFVGDPLDTRFDVAATYTTRTPTLELVRNQVTALTPQQEEAAKRRSPVTVVLRMRGDLERPLITFDIQIGDEEQADPITSVTTQALARLRDNPNELNTQVFSLLLFNSFFSQQSGGGGGLADAGTSVYLSSVSSLLTNQLNRLASQVVKGVDIEIGVESYQSQYDLANSGNTITELQLGVSKQLFNDRLSVQVGGNVNVDSENSSLVQGANFSALSSNFVLEYKLTETGTYRLRVFRRDNFDALNQNNIPQTGVGVTFRKSFGGVKKAKQADKESKKPKKRDATDGGTSDAILPENQLRIERE